MFKLNWLKSCCFLVKLSKKPIAIAAEIVEEPPYDNNGKVIPFVGINDFIFGTNFQANQALKLFNDAGYFGKGIGEGSLKINLPDAHTDFIFSVIAEEFGIIICLMIIFIYTIIILRPIIIAFNCKDIFQILSLSSLSALIGIQSLIHISSNLSIIPTKGMTLPFLSYGGSSTISAAIVIGFLLSLTRKQIDFSEVNLDIEDYK